MLGCNKECAASWMERVRTAANTVGTGEWMIPTPYGGVVIRLESGAVTTETLREARSEVEAEAQRAYVQYFELFVAMALGNLIPTKMKHRDRRRKARAHVPTVTMHAAA